MRWGAVRCGTARRCAVLCGAVTCDIAWYGKVYVCGAVRCGVLLMQSALGASTA